MKQNLSNIGEYHPKWCQNMWKVVTQLNFWIFNQNEFVLGTFVKPGFYYMNIAEKCTEIHVFGKIVFLG